MEERPTKDDLLDLIHHRFREACKYRSNGYGIAATMPADYCYLTQERCQREKCPLMEGMEEVQ